jgi:hypothetical protein
VGAPAADSEAAATAPATAASGLVFAGPPPTAAAEEAAPDAALPADDDEEEGSDADAPLSESDGGAAGAAAAPGAAGGGGQGRTSVKRVSASAGAPPRRTKSWSARERLRMAFLACDHSGRPAGSARRAPLKCHISERCADAAAEAVTARLRHAATNGAIARTCSVPLFSRTHQVS